MAIENPLTEAELSALLADSEDGFIEVDVLVDLSDIIDNDLEGFIDILCEKVGYSYLTDINYHAVEVFGAADTLVIRVTADASEALD